MSPPSVTVVLLPTGDAAVAGAIVGAQEYPADRLELVLADEHGGLERALRAARGELVALLDPARPWLPRKLALQAERFARPEVGLVHGDEELTDVHGHVFARSAFRQLGVRPVAGRPQLELLLSGSIEPSTLMV